MKKTIITLGCCFAMTASFAQNAESGMNAEFSRYLTEHNLWDTWRANRQHFDCPENKQTLESSRKSTISQQPMITDQHVLSALKTGSTLSYRYKTVPNEQLCLGIEARAASYKESYAKDSAFFKKSDLAILDVLQRLPPKVREQSKIIVTDISGSMDPYAEQVLLWHQMNLANEQTKKYVFFNDGDGSTEKIIGKTGGIYKAEGDNDKLLPILSTMVKGMNAGNGDDMPENDMEALLVAQDWMDENDVQQIVLIADANSNMRDFELLSKLNKPVRVILCGVKEIYQGPVINEYATLAHVTGGSLHSLEDDLWDLSAEMNGHSFYMGSQKYEIRKGKLVKVK